MITTSRRFVLRAHFIVSDIIGGQYSMGKGATGSTWLILDDLDGLLTDTAS